MLACRIALLAINVNEFSLALLLLIGAWTGGFVAHFCSEHSEAIIKSLRVWALQFWQLCLPIILWLLGVLSVLTASYDVVGRVAATGCITAAASIAMTKLSADAVASCPFLNPDNGHVQPAPACLSECGSDYVTLIAACDNCRIRVRLSRHVGLTLTMHSSLDCFECVGGSHFLLDNFHGATL